MEKLFRETETEKHSVAIHQRYSKSITFLVLSFVPILLFFGVVTAIQYKAQKNFAEELLELRSEIHIIKLQLKSQLPIETRIRRDADPKGEAETDPDSGVGDGVPIVYDSPYGVDFGHKQSLSVYPTLQGDLKKHQGNQGQQGLQGQQGGSSSLRDQYYSASGFGVSSTTPSTTINYNYHYLGIRRQVPQEDTIPVPVIRQTTTSAPKNASAYGKRLHTFRHSRVSQTVKLDPEDQDQQQPVVQHQQQPVVVTEREQLQFQAATPESVRQFKRPDLKSLDSDSDQKDMVSVHLQAKVSVGDESSSHLATGLHDSWRLSRWSKQHKGSKLFTLEEASGQIKVPESGLYFVYAQVEYLDNHDVNGFEVYLNNEPFISCVASTHAPKEKKKHNTCFTAAVVFVQEGGLLHVRDKEAGRYSLLHSTGTFFGATKISH